MLLLSALSASASSAGVLDSVLTPCSGQSLSQPFLPWADVGNYVLAPNGAFENGTNGWTRQGGAKVVSDNETFKVHASADKYSLSLPAGSSATTDAICVSTFSPTLRLFAINSRSLLSTLKVEVVYKDLLGVERTLTVGLLSGTAAWHPTLPIAFLANMSAPPLVTNGTTAVAFRFTPQGTAAAWRIDDVYVDPFKGS